MPKPQANQGLEKGLALLKSILIDGEILEAWAPQRRLFALTHRRIIIAATSGRFIALSRGLIGGFDLVDFRWQDLQEAKIRVGIFAADITLIASAISDLTGNSAGIRRLTFKGFSGDQTKQIYRLCQAQEQAWREKRRIRELEQMRANAGGIQLDSIIERSRNKDVQDRGDTASRLLEAKQMLDEKLLTDSEYQAIKARIVGGI